MTMFCTLAPYRHACQNRSASGQVAIGPEPGLQGAFQDLLHLVGLDALQLPLQRGPFHGLGEIGADAGGERDPADLGGGLEGGRLQRRGVLWLGRRRLFAEDELLLGLPVGLRLVLESGHQGPALCHGSSRLLVPHSASSRAGRAWAVAFRRDLPYPASCMISRKSCRISSAASWARAPMCQTTVPCPGASAYTWRRMTGVLARGSFSSAAASSMSRVRR